jgi:hypothetical protein
MYLAIAKVPNKPTITIITIISVSVNPLLSFVIRIFPLRVTAQLQQNRIKHLIYQEAYKVKEYFLTNYSHAIDRLDFASRGPPLQEFHSAHDIMPGDRKKIKKDPGETPRVFFLFLG